MLPLTVRTETRDNRPTRVFAVSTDKELRRRLLLQPMLAHWARPRTIRNER